MLAEAGQYIPRPVVEVLQQEIRLLQELTGYPIAQWMLLALLQKYVQASTGQGPFREVVMVAFAREADSWPERLGGELEHLRSPTTAENRFRSGP